MVNTEEQKSVNEFAIDDMDHVDQSNGDDIDDSSSIVVETSTVGTSGGLRENRGSGDEIGLAERLTDILVDDGDGDLLLQQSDREDRLMHWLQALDMQLMGACRADERLKPLLKLNASSVAAAAEDRLLAHLSQHFEPSEVGMLAMCLCIPLVSVRVGKINKQGNLLCPTSTRGNLNLMLLPTSDLRISFAGDDGHTDRVATLSSDSECPSVAIEEIPADKSGRSFLIKSADGEIFYFWCSEKSKLLGNELLEKMKDLLERKPSLAELTGISESRLECFAIHLRAYLVGSSVVKTPASLVLSTSPSLGISLDSSDLCQNAQSSNLSSKPSRSRHCSSQGAKPNSLYQGSLSPRSSSFKEGLPRNLSSLRGVVKLRRRGDSLLSCADNLSVALPSTKDASSSKHSEKDKLPEANGTCLFPPSSFLDSLGNCAEPSFLSPASQVPSLGSSLFSPYYCWCPPVASTLQYAVVPPQLPISSTESLSLPPLTSLLSTTRSPSLLTPKSSLNLADIPSMDFPPFLPEPLVRLPLSMPTSQQIPTFTPLICDPIVHIPVIDVCSSGQGYLVSAGPALSTNIPPLHPKLVKPLIPKTDSVVENGARETLRLLISSSSQANPQFMDVLPSVLSHSDENQGLLAAGSRGLYSGARDVNSITNSIAAMGLVSLSERSVGGTVVKRCISQGDFVDQLEKPGASGGSSSEGGSIFSSMREERSD